ncbi:hypothetical protein [Gluconobacter japonicus]|uniref:hypothetical protein n=1 Tax=Gluconobacter japonicus TaxID=376620 RepID=UPI001B8D92D7|nr:hypothetical protein [Gluconobacter japonicus]MBS1051588.1 hypothetical protein [Gluconobacter japonicus]
MTDPKMSFRTVSDDTTDRQPLSELLLEIVDAVPAFKRTDLTPSRPRNLIVTVLWLGSGLTLIAVLLTLRQVAFAVLLAYLVFNLSLAAYLIGSTAMAAKQELKTLQKESVIRAGQMLSSDLAMLKRLKLYSQEELSLARKACERSYDGYLERLSLLKFPALLKLVPLVTGVGLTGLLTSGPTHGPTIMRGAGLLVLLICLYGALIVWMVEFSLKSKRQRHQRLLDLLDEGIEVCKRDEDAAPAQNAG